MRCSQSRQPLAAEFSQRDEGLWALERVTVTPEGGVGDGATGFPQITGQFTSAPQYRGCVVCGAMNYVKCGCQRLGCWSGAQPFTCPWCGRSGVVDGTITDLGAIDRA